jgi:hypothetical protein
MEKLGFMIRELICVTCYLLIKKLAGPTGVIEKDSKGRWRLYRGQKVFNKFIKDRSEEGKTYKWEE